MKKPTLKKTLLALSLLACGAVGTAYFMGGFGPVGQQSASNAGLISPAMAKNDVMAKMGAHPLGDQAMGQKDAPVVMVEYASFTCPHCASFHKQVFPQIKKELIDAGKLRFIYRDFPLDNTAFAISAITRCVATDLGNEKFFPLINELFYRQGTWLKSKDLKKDIVNIAKLAGYSEAKVDACLKREPITKGLKEVNEHAAQKLGVRGTPTLFINGEIYQGAGNYESIAKKIETLIKQ